MQYGIRNIEHDKYCIMRYKDFDYLRLKKDMNPDQFIHFNIIITSQLLLFPYEIYENFHKIITQLEDKHRSVTNDNNNQMLIIDYEFNTHQFHDHNSQSLSAISPTPVSSSSSSSSSSYHRLKKDQYYDIYTSYISPWNETNTNKNLLLLYMNRNILFKSETFQLNGLTIGIIVYTIMKNSSITILKNWLLQRVQCLRKIGADIVIIVGNGSYELNEEILILTNDYVHFIIGINNNHHDSTNEGSRSSSSDADSSSNQNDINNNSDRIIQLSKVNHVSGDGGHSYATVDFTFHSEYYNVTTIISDIKQ